MNGDDNFVSYMLILTVAILMMVTITEVNNIKNAAHRTDRVVAAVCSVYGEKDPQLALLCAKNGF